MGFLGSLVGGLLSGVGLGDIGGVAGLTSLSGLGGAAASQAEAEMSADMMTAMAVSPFVHQANRAKMFMDAAAGIGQAYINGAANVQNAAFAMNNKIGEAFAKAGGH